MLALDYHSDNHFISDPRATGGRRLASRGWACVGDLPPLTGSPRQVAWARRIRDDKITDLIRELDATANLVRNAQARCPDYRPSLAEADWQALAERRWLPVLSQTSAAWWIERCAWWVTDLHQPPVPHPDAPDRSISPREAEALVAAALHVADRADLSVDDAEPVALDGIILDRGTESGLPVRATVKLGVTGAGTLHQRWRGGWTRKPVAIDWDGAMQLREGHFLPARGELSRAGIDWW